MAPDTLLAKHVPFGDEAAEENCVTRANRVFATLTLQWARPQPSSPIPSLSTIRKDGSPRSRL